MTIFQKMLAVPVLALCLYGIFFAYGYVEYQHSSKKVEAIRNQYLPVLDIANENKLMFSQIRNRFKDAVLADEISWLPDTEQYQNTISNNFYWLKQNEGLIDLDRLHALEESFDQYYINARMLAESIIENQASITVEEDLVSNVEQYHNQAEQQFVQLKQDVHNKFEQTLDETNALMNRLVVVGGIMAIAIMLFILAITLTVSISTRNSVYQVIERMRSLALGSTDFSRRLHRKNKDELSYLIHWFNKLSDKLEQDYNLLETISITDKLTQLNNRNRTDAFLPQALENSQQNKQVLAVIMLDIDHFKSVNDTYGHLVGDEVIKGFASILKSFAREHDFIGRWGGEEFILILPNTDETVAREYAEKLRQIVIRYEFEAVGKLTSSFGIALSRANDSVTTLVQRADDCLYQAKKQGRNCVVVNNEQV